ncbi:MAG: hypothetical protein NT026_02710 [Candidatus Staskawiczbacteria bacterium]|nr:hypothetical protein [Candidatus Staskawiczbacteria bacterium]
MHQRILKYVIIMAIILFVVVLSQQPYFKQWGKGLVDKVTNPAQTYMTKGSSWAKDTVLPEISGEVQKRGDIIKQEVAQEKQKVSENIGEKISNYFSGVANSILHPGAPQNCQP